MLVSPDLTEDRSGEIPADWIRCNWHRSLEITSWPIFTLDSLRSLRFSAMDINLFLVEISLYISPSSISIADATESKTVWIPGYSVEVLETVGSEESQEQAVSLIFKNMKLFWKSVNDPKSEKNVYDGLPTKVLNQTSSHLVYRISITFLSGPGTETNNAHLTILLLWSMLRKVSQNPNNIDTSTTWQSQCSMMDVLLK